MYSYSAFGLSIHSEIELPGFSAGGPEPAISVQFTSLEGERPPYPTQGRRVTAGIINPDLTFWVYDGSEIYLNRDTSLDRDTVRTYLLGLIISAALRQRGLLVLHAACVVKNGSALGFVGNCGYGKSTLASYFHSRGYHMFNDDVMAVDLSTEQKPLALPGSTHVRLREDAGGWLHDDFDELPPVDPSSSKRMQIARSHYTLEPVPLEALYILRPKAAARNEIRPISGRVAVRELIENTRVRNLFTSSEDVKTQFLQCTQVVKSLSVQLLERKKGLENLPEILELVEANAFQFATPAVVA